MDPITGLIGFLPGAPPPEQHQPPPPPPAQYAAPDQGGGPYRDIVVRPRGRERGTLLLIHGGGFLIGRAEGRLDLARVYARRGWRTVMVDYPLGSVPRAMRWSARTARRADRGTSLPVVAVGESAGGTVAAWLAARRAVDAAVDVAGPSHLWRWRPWRGWGRSVGLAGPRTALRWSPALSYGKRSAPLLVMHSRADRVVPFLHAKLLRARGAELRRQRGDHLMDMSYRRIAVRWLERTVAR